jgi:Leucine-rich repeat (LRR) protein
VSGTPVIESIRAVKNQIAVLNLGAAPRLKTLLLRENQFPGGDFRAFADLEQLDLSFNPLATLDVRDLRKLRELSCAITNLTQLNLTGTESLQTFNW